jgi:hypothetical protein
MTLDFSVRGGDSLLTDTWRGCHGPQSQQRTSEIASALGQTVYAASCAATRSLARFEAVEAVEQLFVFLAQGLKILTELLHLVSLFAFAADCFDDLFDTTLDTSV